MAQFEHLPLYRQTFSFLVEFHKLVPDFPKKYKFELGSIIIKDLTKSCLLIIEINSSQNKNKLLKDLILILEKVKIQIRILKCLDIISKNLYFNLSEKLIQLLKQCEGWRKKCA
jgi:hypothetical protein